MIPKVFRTALSVSAAILVASYALPSTCAAAAADTARSDDRAAADELQEIAVGAPRKLGAVVIADGASLPREEITVRSEKSLSTLRRELDAARDKVYEIFNAVNSRDDFDVHCHYERPTGSNVLQRVCRPQFLDDATADSVKALRNGDDPQRAMSRAHTTQQEYRAEMERLVQENPELAAAMREFVEAQDKYRAAHEGR